MKHLLLHSIGFAFRSSAGATTVGGTNLGFLHSHIMDLGMQVQHPAIPEASAWLQKMAWLNRGNGPGEDEPEWPPNGRLGAHQEPNRVQRLSPADSLCPRIR